MSERIPFVVIGGGVMGLSTAWALTRRGERPLVLEQFARGHTRGASHGATRNFNNAYADEHYLDLLALAREGWDALGTPGGEPLLRLHGLVSHGSGAALGGTGAGLVAIHERLRDRGIPAELLDGAEASRRWPGMRFEDTVLFSPDAGVARASVALEELERRIVEGGGEVRWQTPVLRFEEDADGVTVHTAAGTVRADTVIVTVGAWTGSVLDGIPLPPLRVTEESPAHFTPRDPASAWPSFNHFVRRAPGRRTSTACRRPARASRSASTRSATSSTRMPGRSAPTSTRTRSPSTCASGCRGSMPRPPRRSAAPTRPRPTRRSCSTASAGS